MRLLLSEKSPNVLLCLQSLPRDKKVTDDHQRVARDLKSQLLKKLTIPLCLIGQDLTTHETEQECLTVHCCSVLETGCRKSI
jgi:hypothetical protein